MLSMADTGLVQGVPLKGTPLVCVKALGGFYDEQNKPRKTGELVLCSERFARYLICINRAERAELPPAPEPAQPPVVAPVTATAEAPAAEEEAKKEKPAQRGRRLTNEE